MCFDSARPDEGVSDLATETTRIRKDQPVNLMIGVSLHEHCDTASEAAVLTARNWNDCWSSWTDTFLPLLAMLRNGVPPRPFENAWTGVAASRFV